MYLDEEVAVGFDDSLITDKEAELEKMRDDALSFDIPELTIWYLMSAYSITEEEATKLVTKKQEEQDTDGEEED